MDKERELIRAKRLPLLLLVGAALLFIATILWPLYWPPNPWVAGESGGSGVDVGAWDWSRSARFRRVPIPMAGRLRR